MSLAQKLAIQRKIDRINRVIKAIRLKHYEHMDAGKLDKAQYVLANLVSRRDSLIKWSIG